MENANKNLRASKDSPSEELLWNKKSIASSGHSRSI